MNILWLRPSKGDNISVRRERIASELRERGYEIDIVDASGFDAIGAIRQAIRGDYDIIAGNVRVGLYIGFPLAKLLQIPFLGDVSDPITDIDYLSKPLFRFFEWYEWQVLERADATVFVYESSYQKALDRGIDNAVKLPNAVNYEAFANPDEEAVQEAHEVLEHESVDLNKPIAIYIGVFSSQYKIEAILETAESSSDWEFLFVGEGDLEDKVHKVASEVDNVYYPGAFEYRLMPGFLSHADVGFCFKDAEQPLKLKEYAAANIPVIARPGKLSNWYADDEIVFTKPTAEAISSTLLELRDDEVAEDFVRNLHKEIDNRSWKDISDRYAELFEQIY